MPSTREASRDKVKDLVGGSKDFLSNDIPTLRAAIQKGLLLKESFIVQGRTKLNVTIEEICLELAPHITAQWYASVPD